MLSVRTVADMAQLIAANLHRLDRSRFDCVVGIPRSGMLPASMIATHLGLPLADPRGFALGIANGRSNVEAHLGRRVLLVDDSCNKGRAMAKAIRQLPRNAKVTRLAIYGPYQLEKPQEVCDIWFEVVRGPRVFAWNLWKHIRLPRWGFDMDGVLCRDPTKEENDDGPRYLEFMRTAEPLFLPSRPLGHIVTGRLERYRAETIDQLHRHGVQFESLTMMPYASKNERMNAMRQAGGRGGWKAQHVKRLGVEMFVESSPKQAGIIARETGVPVWCTETQALA